MFVLRAFRSEHKVSTFRLAKLSSEFQSMKQEIERRRSAQTRGEATAATQAKAAVGARLPEHTPRQTELN